MHTENLTHVKNEIKIDSFAIICKPMEVENMDRDRTPLARAVLYGDLKAVEFLIDIDRVDVDTRDEWGRTSLSWAVIYGYPEIVKFLAARGASLTTVDSSGLSPLSCAAFNRDQETLEFLTCSIEHVRNSHGGITKSAVHR